MAIPGLTIFVVFYMKFGFDVLANFLGCSVDDASFMLGSVYAGAVIISYLGAAGVGNFMAGFVSIAIGILTMGVFGTAAAEVLTELATIPLIGCALVFALICLIIGT